MPESIAPATVDEASDSLLKLWKAKTRTIVIGGNEAALTGDRATGPVSLHQLDRIVRLSVGVGSIVAQAGVPIAAVRAATATVGLWCPALRWLPGSTPIGVAVAAGLGKRSRAYGSVADHSKPPLIRMIF